MVIIINACQLFNLLIAQKNSLLLLETQRELYRKYCDRYCIIREEKKNKIESIIGK